MKKQELQQISAYDKKAVHDMFIMTMEWLEKYIETVGYYPDWEDRKQIHEDNIKRKDIIGNPEKVKSSFSTVLFILQTNLQDVPPMFREEIKQEFYKWISAVGINVDNCHSDELKAVLYQVNEILKGHGEKIQRDVENRQREVEMDSPEYMDKFKKMFASVQDPIRKEKEVEKTWKNKSDKDWKKESRFNSGSAEQGEQVFNQIAGSVVNQQSDFYFFRQKDQSINPQQKTNYEIIQDVKDNPNNWRFDEIITEYDKQGRATKKEIALIHISAEVGFDGAVSNAQQSVYLAGRFNEHEIAEINQSLNISQTPNYDNWTKEQFIAEINRLKVENEWLRNTQTLTDSERQKRLQENQQQLQSLQVHSFGSLDNSNSNSFPSLFVGGVSLAVAGLISFLIVRKRRKNK